MGRWQKRLRIYREERVDLTLRPELGRERRSGD